MCNYGWRPGSAGVSPAKNQMKDIADGFMGEISVGESDGRRDAGAPGTRLANL
jgi:hypothetical protein